MCSWIQAFLFMPPPPRGQERLYKGRSPKITQNKLFWENIEESINNFKRRLSVRGYLDKLTDKVLWEVKYHERMSDLQNKAVTTVCDRISPFSAWPKRRHNKQMVSYRKSTVAEGNL